MKRGREVNDEADGHGDRVAPAETFHTGPVWEARLRKARGLTVDELRGKASVRVIRRPKKADMPAAERTNRQAAFYYAVRDRFGDDVLEPEEALTAGGHPDTRDLSVYHETPMYKHLLKELERTKGLHPHPLSVVDETMHVGIHDNSDAKAALEQCRKDALYDAFELHYVNETDKAHTCSCQLVKPETSWPMETEDIPDTDRFWSAVRWLHESGYDSTTHYDDLKPAPYLGVLMRDPDPLSAACTYLIVVHGGVLCPIDERMADGIPMPPVKQPADQYRDFDTDTLGAMVKAGHALLKTEAWKKFPSYLIDEQGVDRSVLAVNKQFVVETDKLRGITDMSTASNRYVQSRGASYPTVANHCRFLLGAGGPDPRAQYRLDISGAFTHVRLRPDQLRVTVIQGWGKMYYDADGVFHHEDKNTLYLYALTHAAFGGKNSPPLWLDIILPVLRRVILLGGVTARIFVDDGFGSGVGGVEVPGSAGAASLVTKELTAPTALLLWRSLCFALGIKVAEHKVFLDTDIELLGMSLCNSENTWSRGTKNAFNVKTGAAAVIDSLAWYDNGRSVGVSAKYLEHTVSCARWSAAVVRHSSAFLTESTSQVARSRRYVTSCFREGTMSRATEAVMEEMHFLRHISHLCDGAEIQPGSAQRVHSYRDIGTDASFSMSLYEGGYGIQCYEQVRFGEFSEKWCRQLARLVGKNVHGETSRQLITHLELWTMMRLLVLFGKRLANSIVETAQDNEGVNHWIWRMYSSASHASRGMLKTIVLLLRRYRITLRPVSVRSEFNVIPDAASGICNTGRTGVSTKVRRRVVRRLVDAWVVDTGHPAATTVEQDVPNPPFGVETADRRQLYRDIGWPEPPHEADRLANLGSR